MINWLLRNQYNIGLVTSKDSTRTHNLLMYFNLHIDVVVTPELTQRGKPFLIHFFWACEKFSIDCSQALFVGDMYSDMQVAKAAKNGLFTFYARLFYCEESSHYGSPIFSLLNIIDFLKYQ